jgi:hypothetical protein
VRVTLVISLSLAALVAGGACGGGDGDKTFRGEGYSFTYPGEWDERDVEATPGAVLTTAFAPEGGLNALIFEVNTGPPVTESNIDAFEDQLAEAIQESTEGPTRLRVAGLPALRIVAHPQSGTTRRVTTVFDEETAYIFDCGFTPSREDEMTRGCDQVEDSFQVE